MASMNIPNIITSLRILLIPVFVLIFYLPFSWSRITAALVFALAGITDWIDGYLARTLSQTTKLGAFLDPVADKLLIATALVLIVGGSEIPYLAIPAAVIVGREIVISALREWMAEIGKRTSVAVSFIGKFKTTIQIIAVLVLLIHQPHQYYLGIIGASCLYLAAFLTLWSMSLYLKTAWPDLVTSK